MKDKVIDSLAKFVDLEKEEISSLIETPPNSKLGDYAFPCFVLAKKFKKSPAEIAKDLSKKIKLGKDFEKIEAIGPYINFFINRNILAEETLKQIQKQKDKFGSSKAGKEKIMIEFSQPNTHKAFHVGHIRGTALGESLARIFEFFGQTVIRTNYSGDTGMHIAKWIWCYQKYHKKEKLENDEEWIASIYVDAVKRLAENEDLQEEVDGINRKIESKKDKTINALWKKTRNLSIKSWGKIYRELDTHFDAHFFESEVELSGKKVAENLLEKGIAKKSEDAVIMDLKDYNLGVWVLLRKDGTVLYSAKDIALAERKMKEFPSDKYLVVIGDEQRLHFQQLLKTLEIMGLNKNKSYNFLTYGMVRLPTGKMSSRTGENILYSEFVEDMGNYAKEEIKKRYANLSESEIEKRSLAISISAIKYSMLKQDPYKVIIFDKQEALSFEGNSGPYILYSYARARSILEKANYNPKKKYAVKNLTDLEKNLILHLGKFPEIVNNSYANLAPNITANYAYQISQIFNEFYHSSHIIGSENEQFGLVLVDSFSQVLKNALSLLGISVIEKM